MGLVDWFGFVGGWVWVGFDCFGWVVCEWLGLGCCGCVWFYCGLVYFGVVVWGLCCLLVFGGFFEVGGL